MHSFTAPVVALAAVAAIPAVSAHGYVSGVVSGGTWYAGASPQWIYESTKPQQAGWFAYNQDLGYVSPSDYSDPNITCHKGATPGSTYIDAVAGDAIDFQWTTWPDSHHGPVITYMARCNGECTTVDKNKLEFFKIDAGGLISDATSPGDWATDKLIGESYPDSLLRDEANRYSANNNTRSFTIPADVAPGNFVVRQEIIALHGAESADGAQNYPVSMVSLIPPKEASNRLCRTASTSRLPAPAPSILALAERTAVRARRFISRMRPAS